jgi:hypothetical protein
VTSAAEQFAPARCFVFTGGAFEAVTRPDPDPDPVPAPEVDIAAPALLGLRDIHGECWCGSSRP